MTLMTRVGRLFRADFHAVLDRIEEPELLLRQAIREMEDELVRQEQAIRLAGHDEARCAARQAGLDGRLREIDGELDLCFSSNKEELARGLVRRKLETQRLVRQLAARRGTLRKDVERREATLAENRAALDGLRQKAEIVAVAATDPEAGGVGDTADRQPPVTADDVEVAFLREKQSRSRS